MYIFSILELKDIAIVVRSQSNSYHIKRAEKLKESLIEQAKLMGSEVGNLCLTIKKINFKLRCQTSLKFSKIQFVNKN